MRSKSLFGFDFLLLIATLLLIFIGIMFIYSSGYNNAEQDLLSREFFKQIIWAAGGLIILVLVYFVDYSRFNTYSIHIYLFVVLTLLITLVIGKRVNGAKSWIDLGFGFGIQPSEFAKVATILLLGSYLASIKKNIQNIKYFIGAFLIVALPMALILRQPDLGTSLVFIPVFLIMVFLAGASIRHVLFVLISGTLIVCLTIFSAWNVYINPEPILFFSLLFSFTYIKYLLGSLFLMIILSFVGYKFTHQKYFYWIMYSTTILFISFLGAFSANEILQDFQIMRLIVFLNPYVDPQGYGWNVIQSMTAVGAGGFTGAGWLQGTQSHYRFLPQQSTDFFFSIIAEESGYFGVLIVFSLYVVIFVRGIRIILQAKDRFGFLIALGIITMLLFHFFINIGMAIGIMPITGIPLFFVSYGGSSLWTAMISIGLLLNIYQGRYRY